jgi:hypothetical protein
MVRWRREREDDLERDWWDSDDEEEEAYWPDPYGRSPYGWPTIMGMPYPIAIDIMRGKWPPGHEDSSFWDDRGALDPGGDDLFWDPFSGGGGFFDGGMDL